MQIAHANALNTRCLNWSYVDETRSEQHKCTTAQSTRMKHSVEKMLKLANMEQSGTVLLLRNVRMIDVWPPANTLALNGNAIILAMCAHRPHKVR